MEVLTGDVSTVERLADLPLPDRATTDRATTDRATADRATTDRATTDRTTADRATDRAELLVAVPYRQIAERGFACRDDAAPLLAMRVATRDEISVGQAVDALPDEPIRLSGAGFDLDDSEYADIVRRVLKEEIGQGAGSNFVIRRCFTGRIDDFSTRKALAVFRRLLTGELGAYWTFLFHSGEVTFIGASPERHVSLADRTVVMNPISGTYRHPADGPDPVGLLEFLNDKKEADELYMVVDEELKMMARMCTTGGQVHGPYLKRMARLTHTEYLLSGHSDLDVRDILRETLLAPTVTGSPLRNAFRVISRHETTGRGYYGGVLALIGPDAGGGHTLDSSILIRTGEIRADGRLSVGVGATLVRDSDPDSEVAETHAKAAGLLQALGLAQGRDHSAATVSRPSPVPSPAPSPVSDPRVRRALAERNTTLSSFWLDREHSLVPETALPGRHVLVVDGEDTFTAMLGHQLRHLGLTTTIVGFDVAGSDRCRALDEFDFVVVGPGPGDPCDPTDPRIAKLRSLTRALLGGDTPFLSVCLGHQVLAAELGFEVVRRARPNQGVQRLIDLFGRPERVGFYNTFNALCQQDIVVREGLRGPVRVSRDPRSGEVHALAGPGFRSVQFHPESVLTQHGPRILSRMLTSLIPVTVTG